MPESNEMSGDRITMLELYCVIPAVSGGSEARVAAINNQRRSLSINDGGMDRGATLWRWYSKVLAWAMHSINPRQSKLFFCEVQWR